MSKLVILVKPNEMCQKECEPVLRRLFEKHLYDGVDKVDSFLNDNNISYSNDIGKNENGNTLIAYTINNEKLFAINIDLFN